MSGDRDCLLPPAPDDLLLAQVLEEDRDRDTLERLVRDTVAPDPLGDGA